MQPRPFAPPAPTGVKTRTADGPTPRSSRGTYLWRSPLGLSFLRDHEGTLDVTRTTPARGPARPAPPVATRGLAPTRPTTDHHAPHPAAPRGGVSGLRRLAPSPGVAARGAPAETVRDRQQPRLEVRGAGRELEHPAPAHVHRDAAVRGEDHAQGLAVGAVGDQADDAHDVRVRRRAPGRAPGRGPRRR